MSPFLVPLFIQSRHSISYTNAKTLKVGESGNLEMKETQLMLLSRVLVVSKATSSEKQELQITSYHIKVSWIGPWRPSQLADIKSSCLLISVSARLKHLPSLVNLRSDWCIDGVTMEGFKLTTSNHKMRIA
jgi:hypothetical protein